MQRRRQAKAAAAEAAALREQLAVDRAQLKALRGATDAFRETQESAREPGGQAEERSGASGSDLPAGLECIEAAALRAEGRHSVIWKAKSWQRMKKRARELRQKLDAMGPVNMMALEEYKETAERHAFLETQRKDLVDSIENTQSTIKEIDQISRVKFDEAFARSMKTLRRSSPSCFTAVRRFCA